MAAGLASIGCKLPVVHVEAGLRTRDILSPFPEELNRQLISRMAAFHLAPTPANQANLVREGVDPQRIFVTGNTGIDALHWAAGLHAPWGDPRLEVLNDPSLPVVVVTSASPSGASRRRSRPSPSCARVLSSCGRSIPTPASARLSTRSSTVFPT
jgi:UDP-N-acetylglucosamine 2-epimerase (non-hydrolysing)